MALTSAIDVVNSVKELFSLPEIYLNLHTIRRDQQFTLEDVVALISQDHALTARLLGIVNSPFYGYQSQIDTLGRAISVVGLDDLEQLVLAMTLIDHFSVMPTEWVDMKTFWVRSVHCAIVCKLLASCAGAFHAQRLFLAGLLHDIGLLVLCQTVPNATLRALHRIDHDRQFLLGLEHSLIGFTHAEVGKELLKSWGLPESLYGVVGDYPAPAMARKHKADAYLLHLACRLVDNQKKGILVKQVMEQVEPALWVDIHLNEQQIIDVMAKAEQYCLTCFKVFCPETTFNQGNSSPN